MRRGGRLCAALLSMAVSGACAAGAPLARQQCNNADVELAKVLQPLEALRTKGCDADPARGVVRSGPEPFFIRVLDAHPESDSRLEPSDRIAQACAQPISGMGFFLQFLFTMVNK